MPIKSINYGEVSEFFLSQHVGGNLRDVVANVINCDFVVREFELKSSYYVHFRSNTLGKSMNPFVPPAMG